MRKVSFSALNSFLPRHLRAPFEVGPLSVEIRGINRNSLCTAGISGWFNPCFSTRFLGFETTKLSYMPFICFVDLHLSYLKMVTNIRN
jgi:hypothetical protein